MILPYDVNAYLAAHPALLTLLETYGFDSIQILPLNSAEPCVTTEDECGNEVQSYLGAPFLTYFWMPGVRDNNRYFLRNDRIRYHVLDRDFDRMWNVAEVIVGIFDTDLAPGLQPIDCSDDSNKIMNYHLTNSKVTPPKDSGGLADTMLEIEFLYVRSQIDPLLT